MIRTGLTISAIVLVLMAGVTVWAIGQLPEDNIPIHWNTQGVADQFADRQQAALLLWILPAAAAFSAVVFALLPRIEPMRENLVRSRKAYNAAWITTMLLLLGVHSGLIYMTLQVSGGIMESTDFVRLVIGGTGIMFFVLGNYLPKTRQNWFLGIRTPWTLSSEYTWEKTHRLAGRLFFVVGFVCLISASFVDGAAIAFVVAGASLSAAAISVVYSFLVYQKAPDKRVSPDYIV